MTVSSPLHQPIPFRVLIDEAMKNVRRHFRAIYPAVALPLVLFVIPTMMVYLKTLGTFMTQDPDSPVPPSDFFVNFASVMILFMLWGVMYFFALSVMMASAVDALAGRPVDMKRSWLLMLRPRALGTMLLVGLALFLASLLCFFPVIYVGLLVSLVIPVMVEEERFGTRALKRSVSLVGYNTRLRFKDNPIVKVFLLIVVGFLLSYAVNLLVQMPVIVVQQIFIFRAMAEGEGGSPAAAMSSLLWLQIPSTILSTLAGAVIHLYMSFGLGLLFFDTRRRKEGADLEAALDELAGPSPQALPMDGSSME